MHRISFPRASENGLLGVILLVIGGAALSVARLDANEAWHSRLTPVCATGDSVAIRMRAHLEWWLTDTLPTLVALRTELALAGTPPSSIVAVSDSVACSRARAEYYRLSSTPAPSTPVSVFRLTTTRYAVGDSATLAQHGAFVLTDSAFAIVAVVRY
jgi:hypothetical protein